MKRPCPIQQPWLMSSSPCRPDLPPSPKASADHRSLGGGGQVWRSALYACIYQPLNVGTDLGAIVQEFSPRYERRGDDDNNNLIIADVSGRELLLGPPR